MAGGSIDSWDNSILQNNNVYNPTTFLPIPVHPMQLGTPLTAPKVYPYNLIPVSNSSMGIGSTYPLIPYYQLWFGSFLLNSYWMRFITQIEFVDDALEAGSATIDVLDRDFEFSDYMETVLSMSSEVWLYMGYEDHLRLMLHGVVTGIDYQHGRDGQQSFTINVLDTSQAMNSEKKSRSWEKVRGSDVVRAIADEYGYTIECQDSYEVQDKITQDNETDIALLKKLADDDCFELYVFPDEKKIFYGNQFSGLKACGTLNYKKDDFTILDTDLSFVQANTKDNNSRDKYNSGNISSSSGGSSSSGNDGSGNSSGTPGVDIDVNVEDSEGDYSYGDYVDVVGRTGALA